MSARFLTAEDATALHEETAYFRAMGERNPGTAYLFLKNSSPAPITLTGLELDGAPLPIFGWESEGQVEHARTQSSADPRSDNSKEQSDLEVMAARVIWATTSPNPIPPGSLCEIAIKFARRPERPFVVGLLGTYVSNNKEPPELLLRRRFLPMNRRAHIEAVTFQPSEESPSRFGKMYAYLRLPNQLAAHATRALIEVDGKVVEQETEVLPLVHTEITRDSGISQFLMTIPLLSPIDQ